jgi:alpha-L-fucosidase
VYYMFLLMNQLLCSTTGFFINFKLLIANLLKIRMKQEWILLKLLLCSWILISCNEEEPDALFPIPNEKQLEWFNMEYYGFIHFGPNTFTGNEWGHGDENPDVFNPTAIDTDQWARICKEAGMKGIVLTAKHHDGFCLWPSNYSTHTVRESKWMDGKGDILKMLSASCKKYDLKLGIYLSPWDMNHPDFTTDKYNDVYVETIKEVLANYGDIFEFWYDGGDTGKNGKKQIYDWERFDEVIRKYQPDIMINGCRDLRWVGNEEGIAPTTCWATMDMDSLTKAGAKGDGSILSLYGTGVENGERWSPAECDVSIRPGWFYRPNEDDKVKSVTELFDIYMCSVGRNSTLILNIPPDPRGLIPEKEERHLIQLKKYLEECFQTDLAAKAKVRATNSRRGPKFSVKNVLSPTGYWATKDSILKASIFFEWDKPQIVNAVLLQEYIRLGQRIRKFSVEARLGGKWEKISEGTTIGHKHILRFEDVLTDKLRVNIEDAKAAITMARIGIYNFPPLIKDPKVYRTADGIVSIENEMSFGEIRYTTDGSDPTSRSSLYTGSFPLKKASCLKYMWLSPEDGRRSGILIQKFEDIKNLWKVVSADKQSNLKGAARKTIDGDPTTYWLTEKNSHPHYLVIDMGEKKIFRGFSYLPRQDGNRQGNISEYSLFVSEDNNQWSLVIDHGKFSNIANNPVLQNVYFDRSVKAQFLKFVTHKDNYSLEDSKSLGLAAIAEIDVITE